MPSLTDSEYQQLIAGETGAGDYAADYNTLFPLWFKQFSTKTEELRYLWTKLRTLEFLMGKFRTRYDVVRGTDQSKVSQQFNNSLSMAKLVADEIERKDPSARGIARLGVSQMGSMLPDAIENTRRFDIPRLMRKDQ